VAERYDGSVETDDGTYTLFSVHANHDPERAGFVEVTSYMLPLPFESKPPSERILTPDQARRLATLLTEAADAAEGFED